MRWEGWKRRRKKKEKPYVGVEPTTFRLEVWRATIAPAGLLIYQLALIVVRYGSLISPYYFVSKSVGCAVHSDSTPYLLSINCWRDLSLQMYLHFICDSLCFWISITIDGLSTVKFQVYKDVEDWLNIFPSFYRGMCNWIYDIATTISCLSYADLQEHLQTPLRKL